MSDRREVVLWYGRAPRLEVVAEFDAKGLRLEHVIDPYYRTDILPVRAVVFEISAECLESVVSAAEAQAGRALDYNRLVIFNAVDDRSMGNAQKAIGEILALPHAVRRTGAEARELAALAQGHDKGGRPRLDLDISIANDRRPLEPGDTRLFRRAFADCTKVSLVELTGGRSDARVFAVHRTMDGSDGGVWPQPAFAKLDSPHKIALEYQNYRKYAEPFIPFGLRPNVSGTYEGSEKALMVGNFVDRSESLWDLARRNVADEAINSLIDDTLAGWRAQAYTRNPDYGSIAAAMQGAGIFDPEKLQRSHLKHAERQGLRENFPKLWERLKAHSVHYRACPIHGDLHGENVRVRKGQAILIDLASVAARGPAVADLASLEVWLAFELPPECDADRFGDDVWTREVDRLLAVACFQHPPGPVDPLSRFAWMANVVRQIRHMGIAAQTTSKEYQTAVAVQLLRRCQWDGAGDADRYRRSHGYVIALNLIKDVL
ncbi:phosphotransferase [Rhizobium sp. 007]|uniref:phosphotransferase n=1 Tax=Rhizobium sp. 007 TaxID=2785056 RepID=UPI00189060EF|nr:phosphotransferase [Rhizobium sp. 007]QPB24580.1 phosphotransferase [Rhizobium sp. 007]